MKGKGARVNPVTYNILAQRMKQMGNLPAMPTVLATLCETLGQRANQIDLDKVVREISYDKSLAAQCLRLANSALFRQRGDVATVKEAVIALGLWRIRDLVFSCSLPIMFANVKSTVVKEVFWRHALGTGIVAQGLGAELGAKFPEEIYLAGLLHDIGILANGILFADDYQDVLHEAKEKRLPLERVEESILGFTHAESGRILAELWRLPIELSEVIEHHSCPEKQHLACGTTVLVHAANLVCHGVGLGYGYEIDYGETGTLPSIWASLGECFPISRTFSEETYSALLKHLVSNAEELADHVFAPANAT